jgi:hypothetical protein
MNPFKKENPANGEVPFHLNANFGRVRDGCREKDVEKLIR